MPVHDLLTREWPELARFFDGTAYPPEVAAWPPPFRWKWAAIANAGAEAGFPGRYAEKRATVLMRRQMTDPTTSQRMQDGGRIIRDAIERPRMAPKRITKKDRRIAREEGGGLFDISDASESNDYQPGRI